jgi:type II secretory pathway pseudopilin PulG
MSLVKNRERGLSPSFTLFELLIVVVLIIIIISFVANSPILSGKKPVVVQLSNLPQVLKTLEVKEVEFYLLGRECDEVLWLSNGESLEVEYEISLSDEISAYRLNYYGELRKFEFPNLRIGEKEEKVCLKFQLFKNGSTTSTILEADEKVYFYNPYFKKPLLLKTIEEAKEHLVNEDLNPEYL